MIAEFPPSNFLSIRCFLCKKLNLTSLFFLLSSLFGEILGINHWNLMNVFCRKGVFKNFTVITGKHMCQSLSLNKVGGWRLQQYLKRDPGAGVFLRILQTFYRQLFYRTPQENCFWNFLFYRVLSSLYDQNIWNVSVKEFNFSKVADLFCKRSPSACFWMNKIKHFVQHNDQRKTWDKPNEITKYKHIE